MAVVGDVAAKLTADVDEFKVRLEKAERALTKLSKESEQLNGKFDTLSKSATQVMGRAKQLAAAWLSVQGAMKAFDLAKTAAGFEDARRIFAAAGGDLDELRRSVNGMVSDFELVKKANLARTMGIDADAFGKLAQAAIAASSATGESVGFMLDSIVKGVSRGSPLILDNLGIVISLEEANREYAASLGTTADKLSKSGQAQAVLNATLKATKPIVEGANKAGANTAEIYAQTAAAVDNLSVQLGQALMPALAEVLPELVKVANYLGYLITGSTPEFAAEDGMGRLAEKTASLSAQLAKAKGQLKGLQEAMLMGTAEDYIEQVLPGLKAYSPEAAVGALEMMIEDLKEQIGGTAARARGGGGKGGASTGPLTKPDETDPGAAIIAGLAAQRVVDELLADPGALTASILNPLGVGYTRGPDIGGAELEALGAVGEEIVIEFAEVTDATAAELEDLARLVGFAADQTEGVIDVFDNWSKALEYGEGALREFFSADNMANLMGAIADGHGGQAAGQQLGAIAGSVVDVATGGATGGLGAAIGGIIGGIFGGALDELVNALQVLTPLFDLVGMVIKGFQPILIVLREGFASMRDTLGPLLGTIILDLARPLAALIVVGLRLLQTFLALAPMFGVVQHLVVMWADAITVGVKALDDNFLRPLVKGARELYNGFVGIVNGIVEWVRTIPGFEDFGTTLATVDTEVGSIIGDFISDIRDPIGEQTDATKDNTDAMREVSRSLTNIPTGYRVALAEYQAERPDGPGSGGVGGAGRIVFQGPVTFQVATTDLERDLRRQMMRRRGVPYGGPSSSNPDERN